MIFICIYVILGLICYQVFKPLISIVKLKFQYGNRAIISFFPIFGDLLKLRKYTQIYGEPYLKFQKQFGQPPYPIFRLSNLMNQPLIGINDPEYYKVILQEHQHFKKINNLLHNGLVYSGMVYSDGIKWHSQRTLFHDWFQYDRIISRLPMMNQIVDQELLSYDGSNLQKKMFEIASQVVSTAFFGKIKLEVLDDLPEIFNYLAGLKFSNPFILIKSVILGQNSWKYLTSQKEKEIEQKIQRVKLFLENLINDRLESMKTNSYHFDQSNKDFLHIHLDYYLNQDKNQKAYKMTIDDIIQQFITFYFAGSDTTASSSSSTLALLAQYPEYQLEIYEEIITTIKDEQVTIDQIQKLVKLNAFIKETLRLRGPVQNLIPRRVQKDIQINDLKLKKGWFVVIDNFINRGSEKYIDEPLTFNYKRWLIQQNPFKNDNGYCNIPFSGGARNCIGQHLALLEIKVIVVKMLLKFELKLKQPLKWQMRFVYQYFPDNIIEFKQRNS